MNAVDNYGVYRKLEWDKIKDDIFVFPSISIIFLLSLIAIFIPNVIVSNNIYSSIRYLIYFID